MLSFELSAIDIILVISVIVLLILFITKMSGRKHEEESLKSFTKMPARKHEESFRQTKVNNVAPERTVLAPQNDYTKCPRGYGNIRKLGEDNSVSEKCLGCYRIMECYS